MLAILFLIFFCGIARADVYVVTAPDKSVYSISEAPDAVAPDGYKTDILRGQSIKDLPLAEDQKMYNFNGKKFVLDAKKVTDRSKAEKDAILEAERHGGLRKSALTKIQDVCKITEEEMKAIFK